MLRTFVVSMLTCSLLCPSHLLAATCRTPFGNTTSQFQLLEQLSCTSETSPVVLQLLQSNQPTITSSISPDCEKDSPYFKLVDANLVIEYSDPLANALSSIVRVLDYCQGGMPVFLINRQPALYTLPSGTKINTSLRVFTQNDAQTLIGYVTASEDTANGLVLRGSDTLVLSKAVKAFSMNGNDCKAIWTVTNPTKRDQVATVMSFLLTLKDNPQFTCRKNPSENNCVSGGAMFGVGLLVGTAFVTLVLGSVACYLKHRHPGYYQGIKNRAIADNVL